MTDYERDYVQEWKDDVAQGHIDEDGNPLDPPEPWCFGCMGGGWIRVPAAGQPGEVGLDGPVCIANCPDCNPSRDERAARDAEYAELVAAGLAHFDDDPPF
jgi:hypothetical protein